jgi:hypothetical protein
MNQPGHCPTRDLLVRQHSHHRRDPGPIGYPNLRLDHSPLSIEHDERGHRVDAEASRSIHADRIQHVQPHHAGAALQVILQPIHDRLGHQARASKIRVKLDHLGRAVGQQRVQLLPRS